jgi:hypothetical protein
MIAKASSSGAVRYSPPGFEVQPLELIGLSMFPALLPGDRLDLEIAGALSTGDVVAFVGASGGRVAHRVLGRCCRSGDYLTVGDASTRKDAPVPETAMIGRVVTVRRCALGRWLTVPRVFWCQRLLPAGAVRTLAKVASRLIRFRRRIDAG